MMLRPALDEDGEILLYDIFVAGRWVGSRRTLRQAIDALRHQGWPSSVLATDSEINHEQIYFPQ